MLEAAALVLDTAVAEAGATGCWYPNGIRSLAGAIRSLPLPEPPPGVLGEEELRALRQPKKAAPR